jgi:hypothetical protein
MIRFPIARAPLTRAPLTQVLTAAALLAACGGPALGQNTRAGGAARVATVPLAPDPVRIESVGLRFWIPEGATSSSAGMGGAGTVQIVPADSTWLLTINTHRTANNQLTPGAVGDDLVRQLLGQSVNERANALGAHPTAAGELVDRVRDLRIGNTTADRFYVRSRVGENDRVMRGYSVFVPSPGNVVTFELYAPEAVFNRAREAYETIVASAIFEDPGKLADERGEVVRNGIALLGRLTHDDILSMIQSEPERWERLYRPAATGADNDATELGYRRLRMRLGQRGEVDPRKAKNRWTSADREDGYIVQLDARGLRRSDLTGAVEGTVDVQAIYWLSIDRESEAWLNRTAIRTLGARAAQVWVELGARDKNGMSVSIAREGGSARNIKPIIQGDGYISQVELQLLPQIMLRGRVTGEYGFYAFRSSDETIKLRREIVAQDPTNPKVWTITTRPSEDAEAQVSTYSEDGTLLRTIQPGGTIQEPTAVKRLADLWKRKGLPME